MKIEASVLIEFLKKARLDGKQKIEAAALNFTDSGLKLLATSPTAITQSSAWLKCAAFKEYETLGVVAFNDLSSVQNCFARFNGDITIKKSGNCLTVTGTNKKVDIELVSEQFLPTDTAANEMAFDNVVIIDSGTLKEITKDVQLNVDSCVIIKTDDKKVIFSNTGKYKFETTIEAPQCKKGTIVKFGAAFIECIRNLDGMLQLSVKSDYPVKILESTDNSVISIICAPMVEDA